ncbi:MAG TPA: hypothetical protein VFE30_11755 [Anaeromyxobacteraceae bacterium]|jgi:hypothetical protein|nr:hypothetical protein [Anaeromyxobacteraceae bacterium]
MTPGTGEVRGGLIPQGEALRAALRWMGERQRNDPALPRARLIDEAALRFDLSPPETEFLLRTWDVP